MVKKKKNEKTVNVEPECRKKESRNSAKSENRNTHNTNSSFPAMSCLPRVLFATKRELTPSLLISITNLT